MDVSGSRRVYLQKISAIVYFIQFTNLKYNIAPENIPSQQESSLPTIIFQGQTVKLQGV